MQKKILLVIAILLIMILSISIYISNYFKNSTMRLDNTLSNIERSIDISSWNKGNIAISDFKKQWEASKGTWAIFIDHMEIDNIEESINRLENYVKVNDRDQALPEIAVLKQRVTHIYENEKFNLKNIL